MSDYRYEPPHRLAASVSRHYDGRWLGRVATPRGVAYDYFATAEAAWEWVADVAGRSLGDLEGEAS